MLTVLLTRAEGLNDRLAERLRGAGIHVVEIPMLVIAPCVPDAAARRVVMDLDRYDHIVFVSGNAVRHALDALEQYWPQWPISLAWHAVGEATAALLRARDLAPRVPAEASSEGLIASGAFDAVDGARILIVRGRGGREWLADELRRRGAEVDYLEVYERRSVVLDTAARQALLALTPAVAVVYSGETAEALAANLGGACGGLSIVVPSGRVGSVAADLGFGRIIEAGGADEQAMLDAILAAAG